MNWHALLNDATALREAGLFVAEGRLVLDLLLSGASGGLDAVVAVLATPAAAKALALDTRLGDRLEVRSPREMEAITGFNFHRGVLALVRRPAPLSVEALISAAGVQPPLTFPDRRASATATSDDGPSHCRPPTADCRRLFVALEHLGDPDNVGSCFRNARAFGGAGVIVDARCADPLYRKAVRTSQGATIVVPWAQAPLPDMLAALAACGVATIGLTPQGTAGARDVPTLAEVNARVDTRAPIAILVGNEGHGLSAATLDACTHLARIPMAAGADSINVATALAVALYQFKGGSGL